MPKIKNKIHKITHGFVDQVFDIKTGDCLSQEFIAGDECEWEKEDQIVDEPENMSYQPFEMVAP